MSDPRRAVICVVAALSALGSAPAPVCWAESGVRTDHGLRSGSPHTVSLLDFDAPSPSAISPLHLPLLWLGTRLTSFGDCERGAVSLIPVSDGLGPLLMLEGGSLFDVDTQRLARPLGVPFAALEQLGYKFGDAHLGLQLGCPRIFRLLLRAGLSMLISSPSGLDPWRAVDTTAPSAGRPSRTLYGASARVLLQIYL